MGERKIATGIGTYQRPDGLWTHGMLGDIVDVHEDDVERFDRFNVGVAAESEEQGETPEPPYPAGDPSEDWTGKQLDAYAEAKGVDVSKAKNKAERVAAIAEAAAAATA